MSTFAYFQKMNQKLEEGWKLTNVSCPICSMSILGRLDTKEMYCVKCEMPVKMQVEDEEEEQQDDVEVIGSGSKDGKASPQDDDFDNMVIARQRELQRQKSDELSKKMGEKLLQGWGMMEEACFECLFPYMRSRQGEIVCVGCGPVKDKKPQEEEKEIPAKTESPVKNVKESPKKQEKTVEKKPVEEPSAEELIEEITKDKKEKKEKADKKEKSKKDKKEHKKEHKKDKEHKRMFKRGCARAVDADQVESLLEMGNFNESLSFYSKITSLLNSELDKISESGLDGNTDKLWEILALQKKVDKTKVKIVKNLAQ